jgi:hypothetical protein
MAQPLMDYPLGPRDDIAGVYKGDIVQRLAGDLPGAQFAIVQRTLDLGDGEMVKCPQINAWTEVTAQRMLAEADSIDALRREKRPLPPSSVWQAISRALSSPSCSARWISAMVKW